jgi:hypothetical protein
MMAAGGQAEMSAVGGVDPGRVSCGGRWAAEQGHRGIGRWQGPRAPGAGADRGMGQGGWIRGVRVFLLGHLSWAFCCWADFGLNVY